MKSVYDNRKHEKLIEEVLHKFYEAFCEGEQLILYSYLDTSFQRQIPLNYFVIHERFRQNLGTLVGVQAIQVDKENNTAFANITVEENGVNSSKSIELVMDYGGWKICGSVFSDI